MNRRENISRSSDRGNWQEKLAELRDDLPEGSDIEGAPTLEESSSEDSGKEELRGSPVKQPTEEGGGFDHSQKESNINSDESEDDSEDKDIEEGGFKKIKKSGGFNDQENSVKSKRKKKNKKGGVRLADQEAEAMKVSTSEEKSINKGIIPSEHIDSPANNLEDENNNSNEKLFQEEFRRALEARFDSFNNWDKLQNKQAKIEAIEEAIKSLPADANVNVFRNRINKLLMPIYHEVRRALLDRVESKKESEEDKESSSAPVAESSNKRRLEPLTGVEESLGVVPTKKGVRTLGKLKRVKRSSLEKNLQNLKGLDISKSDGAEIISEEDTSLPSSALNNQSRKQSPNSLNIGEGIADGVPVSLGVGKSARLRAKYELENEGNILPESENKEVDPKKPEIEKPAEISSKDETNLEVKNDEVEGIDPKEPSPKKEIEPELKMNEDGTWGEVDGKKSESETSSDPEMRMNEDGTWTEVKTGKDESETEIKAGIDSEMRQNEDGTWTESIDIPNLDKYTFGNSPEREKILQERLESADTNLTSVRHAYYEARRKKMRWVPRPGSKKKLEELRQKYDEALSKKVRAKIEFGFVSRSEGLKDMTKEELEWVAIFDINARSEENQKVWQEEFDSSEKSWTRKFEGWWQKHSKKRMVLSVGLLGASFIPGAGAITIPLRAGLRGVGTGMLVEQSLGRHTKILGNKGLSNKILRGHKRELKKGDVEGLKKEIENLPPEKVQAELDRLTVLAERQGVSLMEVGDGKLKPVIEALYEKNVITMYEKTVSSSESKLDDKVADGVMGFLDNYQKDIHLVEESRGQTERKKELARWALATAAGTAMAALPFMFHGHEASEGAVATQEVSGVEVPVPAVNLDSGIPSVSVPEGLEPNAYQGALDMAGEVGAEGHNSVWDVLEAKAEAVAGTQEAGLGEGKFTYLVDSIKDQIAEDPTKFGLPADIDRITAEQLSEFAQNNNLNELVASSFFEEGTSNIAEGLKEAAGLSDSVVANIEANNDFYQAVVSGAKESGVTFDQAMYNIMDQAKIAGLDPARTAEVVANIGHPTPEIVPQIMGFYTEHPDISPSEVINNIISQHGSEVAANVADITGSEMSVATEKLINSGVLDYGESAKSWIQLTELSSHSAMREGVIKASINNVFSEAGLNGVFEKIDGMSANDVNLDLLDHSEGKIDFVAKVVEGDQISFTIDTNNMSIAAEGVIDKSEVESLGATVSRRVLENYGTQNPAEALKKVVDAVTGKEGAYTTLNEGWKEAVDHFGTGESNTTGDYLLHENFRNALKSVLNFDSEIKNSLGNVDNIGSSSVSNNGSIITIYPEEGKRFSIFSDFAKQEFRIYDSANQDGSKVLAEFSKDDPSKGILEAVKKAISKK